MGVGHTSAAKAVGSALGGHDVEVNIVDAYQHAVPFFSKIAADGYIRMVKIAPWMYGFLYDRVERARKVGSSRKWLSRLGAQNLHALIGAMQPSCVVCTHAFPCGIMADYKATIDPTLPVLGIVTDYVVHPFWIYRNIDAYAVATPQMRDTLIARGINPSRVQTTGIPVDPRFGVTPSKTQARLTLGLGTLGARRLVLVMAGGLGIGPLEMMLRGLEDVSHPVAAVVLTGKNVRRESRLREWASRLPYPVLVRGFEENVYDYMHAADLLLTKPGGLTISEALVARLPMVLVKPLGGQEERNTRHFLKQRAAFRAYTREDVTRAVERLLDAQPHDLERLFSRAEALRKPEAAADVAQMVRGLIGQDLVARALA
ncbi:MAG TPA: glycosyltransferase [Candidatus Acidoferrales bacterium]|nr:glycosyltransferase [Candidatus Acidoferrales bacterium]